MFSKEQEFLCNFRNKEKDKQYTISIYSSTDQLKSSNEIRLCLHEECKHKTFTNKLTKQQRHQNWYVIVGSHLFSSSVLPQGVLYWISCLEKQSNKLPDNESIHIIRQCCQNNLTLISRGVTQNKYVIGRCLFLNTHQWKTSLWLM